MFINYIGRLGANVATDGQQIALSLAENDSAQLQTVPILQGKPSLVDLFNLSETRLLYDWLLRSKTKLPSAINEPYPQMPLSTQYVINANCCRADRLSYRVTYEWVTHFAGKKWKSERSLCINFNAKERLSWRFYFLAKLKLQSPQSHREQCGTQLCQGTSCSRVQHFTFSFHLWSSFQFWCRNCFHFTFKKCRIWKLSPNYPSTVLA